MKGPLKAWSTVYVAMRRWWNLENVGFIERPYHWGHIQHEEAYWNPRFTLFLSFILPLWSKYCVLPCTFPWCSAFPQSIINQADWLCTKITQALSHNEAFFCKFYIPQILGVEFCGSTDNKIITNKKIITKATGVGRGLCQFIIKGRQGKNSRQKPWNKDWSKNYRGTPLINFIFMSHSFCFLKKSRTPAQGWYNTQ